MKKTFTLLFIACMLVIALLAIAGCTEGGGSSGGGGDDPASSTAGLIDTTFNPGTGPDNIVYCVTVKSDGKIIIGGLFANYSGEFAPSLARINSDGTRDTTFNQPGINSEVKCEAIQSYDKIIIGGMFNNISGTDINRIARINSDGTLDATFVPTGTGLNDAVNCASIQSDGKIIIGGDFSSYNGTSRNCIARLNSDGTLDAAFNPGTGTNNSIYCGAIQSDGKIIIGGGFITYNGTGRNRIARINSDGTLDATFNPGSGADANVHCTAIQSDGKIIIGGRFTTYDGTSRNYIARINSDGTLDAAFNPGTGANSYVYCITIQSDGKIIIGGRFSAYNGTSRNRIARINSNGTLDTTFNPRTGTSNNEVLCAAIQSNGKIIIGGSFTSYNGTVRNRIARVLN